MAPATGPTLTSAQIRTQLQQFLAEQLGANHTNINQGLALFDSTSVQKLVPDPKLRAAIAALTGTSLEPAISYFEHNTVYFNGTPPIAFGSPDTLTAASETRRGGFPVVVQILIDSRYETEPWQLFIALIGHELQHTQSTALNVDEVITNFELAIEYAELLAKHPQLAYLNTELARRLNGLAELLLNSRHPDSAQPVIIASDGLGLAPGSTNSFNDWWSDYGQLSGGVGGSTSAPPGEAQAVLGSLLPGVTLPNPLNYDQTTAGLFEHMADPNLTPVARLRLSVLLQLVPVSQIATKLGITSAQAIATFGLQPILDIIAAGQHAPY